MLGLAHEEQHQELILSDILQPDGAASPLSPVPTSAIGCRPPWPPCARPAPGLRQLRRRRRGRSGDRRARIRTTSPSTTKRRGTRSTCAPYRARRAASSPTASGCASWRTAATARHGILARGRLGAARRAEGLGRRRSTGANERTALWRRASRSPGRSRSSSILSLRSVHVSYLRGDGLRPPGAGAAPAHRGGVGARGGHGPSRSRATSNGRRPPAPPRRRTAPPRASCASCSATAGMDLQQLSALARRQGRGRGGRRIQRQVHDQPDGAPGRLLRTPAGIRRRTYRNFFHPHQRWHVLRPAPGATTAPAKRASGPIVDSIVPPRRWRTGLSQRRSKTAAVSKWFLRRGAVRPCSRRSAITPEYYPTRHRSRAAHEGHRAGDRRGSCPPARGPGRARQRGQHSRPGSCSTPRPTLAGLRPGRHQRLPPWSRRPPRPSRGDYPAPAGGRRSTADFTRPTRCCLDNRRRRACAGGLLPRLHHRQFRLQGRGGRPELTARKAAFARAEGSSFIVGVGPRQGRWRPWSRPTTTHAGVTAAFNLNLLDPHQPRARRLTSTPARFAIGWLGTASMDGWRRISGR